MIKPDWETLAKRLMVAGQYGFRIEQESGHRWIYFEIGADNFPKSLMQHPDVIKEVGHDPDPITTYDCILKEYGSVTSALNRIDAMLESVGEEKLLDRFEQTFNYYDNLGVVFGEGTQ